MNFNIDSENFFAKETRRITRLMSYKTFRSVEISSKTEESNEYWVQPRWVLPDYDKMANFCKEAARTAYPIRPKLNSLCMVDCEGSWCRARVWSINPLRVFFIDFGYSECVQVEDLRELPLLVRRVIPLAVRIKLAQGTPSKYHQLPLITKLKVKAVDLLPDMRLIVEVKDE